MLGKPNKQICHCSGALSSTEVFFDVRERGAYGYSIHPLFPISDKLSSYREIADAFFCLEGDGPGLVEWERFFTHRVDSDLLAKGIAYLYENRNILD